MIKNSLKKRRGAKPRRKPKTYRCPCCHAEGTFVWKCKCGFEICQDCMLENAWGLTCNHVTWTCPDCGGLRSY